MRATLLPAFVFFTLITLFRCDSLFAQSQSNLHFAKVYTLDQKVFRGILSAADDRGVYLVRKLGDSSVFVNASQIKEIKLRKRAKAGTGTTIGFLSGLAAGTGLVVALHNDDRLQNAMRTVGAVLLTFTTTAIAGAIASKPDEIIQINGRNEDFLQSLNHIKSFTPAAKR